ncbi:MAG TPA: VCBS repeat-containing protein [Gaiellaceae bacterium]|nr:VCBS repeat-containing protein [Gaiellaceae bacterium]
MRRWVVAAVSLAFGATEAASPKPLALRRVDLDLPGPPAAVVAADLDRDGRRDLLVVTATTSWGSIMEERIEAAIEVTEVVPALFDKREARAFLAQADGTYRAVPALSLPAEVLAVAAGPTERPLVALTSDGLSEVALVSKDGVAALDLVPFLSEPSAFAGSRTFLAEYAFLRDVDGDGALDAVIPTPDGIAIHPKLAEATSYRGRLPGDTRDDDANGVERTLPVPDFLDVDGDGVRDLVVRDLGASPQRIAVARGKGGGAFGAPSWVALGCLVPPPKPKPSPAPKPTPKPKRGDQDDEGGPSEEPKHVVWIGDLDGDGHAEVVTREGLDTKSGMKQAKKPRMRYEIHRLKPDLTVETAAKQTFEALGYAFSGGFQDDVDIDFLDLDADGRKDLVTITLDFSVFQLLRAMTAKKIGIGLEFHVLSQKQDGAFSLVEGQTLDEKLRLDLNHLEVSRLGQFRGDFDGDGRIDFVHLGKGTSVTIHRGQPGGRYPEKPDLEIALDEEPQDVMLVRVTDLDGDGRSDLGITRTLEAGEAGTTAPARLELRLSGGAK